MYVSLWDNHGKITGNLGKPSNQIYIIFITRYENHEIKTEAINYLLSAVELTQSHIIAE